jgi:hypothetical protein
MIKPLILYNLIYANKKATKNENLRNPFSLSIVKKKSSCKRHTSDPRYFTSEFFQISRKKEH